MFAVAGMIGAPIGSWLSAQIPETWLLTLFGLLMLVVAVRMWKKSDAGSCSVGSATEDGEQTAGRRCRRDAHGRLQLNTPCARLLGLLGVAAGVLSGLFGVGGGFIIVPALVLFSGLEIHRAVGTSLLVLALISASGVASHLWAGRDIPLNVTMLFIAGGLVGMFAGIRAGRYLSGPALQKVFAAAIVCVATFVIFRAAAFHSS